MKAHRHQWMMLGWPDILHPSMTHLGIDLPDDVAGKLQEKAAARGQTASGYVAELVCQDITSGWPSGFFREVVGAWKGEPLARLPQGEFESRDEL